MALVEKVKETSEIDKLTRESFDTSLSEEDWEKLKAIRVVAILPKEDFFKSFLTKFDE